MNTSFEALPMSSNNIRIQKFVNHSSENRIHWHEEIEILYFIKGTGTVSCNLKKHSVKQGDIVFFNGKELHTGCIRGQDTVYYCIHVNTNFFHNLIGDRYVVFQNIITSPEGAELLDGVVAESESKSFEGILKIQKLMCDFFLLLGHNYAASVLSEDSYKKQFLRLDTFNSVIEYIDCHYDEDLNINTLSGLFFLSPSYLSHLFKRKAGRSITAYINEVRISRAKTLLERESLPIGRIAGAVGFSDINYFSRKFKEITGMTPSEYKRNT